MCIFDIELRCLLIVDYSLPHKSTPCVRIRKTCILFQQGFGPCFLLTLPVPGSDIEEEECPGKIGGKSL